MDIFISGFWVLIALCVILYTYTRTTTQSCNEQNFISFQRAYLVVYLFAMAGDWMQGPYVYALYDFYGMSTHDIEVLFVAGFGSSMIFGTFVGSVADKYGRRANCILYGILYSLACVTKHFNNFWILMVGRLLGGIATSILYSAFESWLVCEHNKRGFDSDLLSNVFSHAVLGNSIVAIIAGLVAQQFADIFGFVAPFDVSMSVLVIMCVVIVFTWTENHGDANVEISKSFKSAATAIRTDPKILCLGLIQSLFEGSMYTFVLEWTPALTPKTADGQSVKIPHGYIFAAFMVSIMIGSSLFKLLTKYSRVESFMRVSQIKHTPPPKWRILAVVGRRPVLLLSAASLAVPIIFQGNQLVIFIGFLVFEVCVGIFWPSLGTMRGKYVPEEARSTIMNFFRVPLNLIVVVILTQNLGMNVIFSCCVVFLLLSTLCQQWLYREYLSLPAKPSTPGKTESEKEAEVQHLIEANEQAEKAGPPTDQVVQVQA